MATSQVKGAGVEISGGTGEADTGTIVPHGNGSTPTGWLLCNGSAVSRTTYSDLFAVIGTTWGSGDGSTTFNLPDFDSRTPIGQGQGSGLTNRTLADTGGSDTHTLSESELPSHNHSIGSTVSRGSFASFEASTADPGFFGSRGGSASHNNLGACGICRYIIKT